MTTNKIIQKAAFEMFRDWTKAASEMYPNMDFSIIDETELVEDTKESIAAALRSLFSSKYNEKRENQNWCIGFISGYIKGNLEVKWFHNYYQKQTDDYRNMNAIKSIQEYLQVDSDLSWKLDAIYKHLITSCNLANVEYQTYIDQEIFDRYNLLASNTGYVEQALDNLLTISINKIINQPSIPFPDRDYFSREEILSFITVDAKLILDIATNLPIEEIENL